MLKFSFIPGNSFLHRADAVSKFAWLVAIACIGYVITNPVHQFILTLAIIVCALWLARLPVGYYLVGFRFFMYFSLFLFTLQILFAPSEGSQVYFHWAIFTISQVSVRYAFNLSIRVINVGSSALVFLMTTDPSHLLISMVKILRVPYRFAYAFYASLRYIPVFENEARNIFNAHAVRGAGLDEGFLSRLRLVSRLTIPLLAGGLRRAKGAAIAMEGRAFGAYPTKTISQEYPIPRSGIVFAVVWWVIFVIYLLWVLSSTGFIRT